MPPGQQAGFPQACPEYKSILGFGTVTRALDAFINGSLSFAFPILT